MTDQEIDPKIERDFVPLDDEVGEQYPTNQWSLCLSGGGFRAMLFHTGALWRLHETKILPRIAFFSSVSGGSIANAWLALNWAKLQLPETSFEDVFVTRIRAMARSRVDIPAIVGGALWGGVPRLVAAAYDRTLFEGARLQSLPDEPRFIFTSANLQSGALWRFSKPYMGDYKVGRILAPDLPLSTAVAASSAFPPFLSPLYLHPPVDSYTPGVSALEVADARFRTRVMLTDGGVYDNLGLEPVIKRTRTILASDGGMPFATKPRPSRLWPCQILRVLDCEDNQVRSLRRRDLIDRFQMHTDLVDDDISPSTRLGYRRVARSGTYWGIRTAVADYPTTPGLPCPPNRVARLASISTRLWRVAEADQERLINWGYAVCDYAIRAHVDPGITPASAWPFARGLD